jgi:hypothetical protein
MEDLTLEILKIFAPLLRDLLLVAIGGLGGFAFLRFWYKKEQRFFNNIQKPFIIFRLTDQQGDMELEMEMLKNNGLFSPPTAVLTDARSLDWINDQSLVIIAIDKNTTEDQFKFVYRKAAERGVPVIIYTLGDSRIPLCDSELVKTYSKRVIVNQPLRLVSDIFTILSTSPDK